MLQFTDQPAAGWKYTEESAGPTRPAVSTSSTYPRSRVRQARPKALTWRSATARGVTRRGPPLGNQGEPKY